MVVDFGDWGMVLYLNGHWQGQIHAVTSNILVTGDVNGDGKDEVIVDFGNMRWGISIYYSAASAAPGWTQLINQSSKSFVCADLHGQGGDDLVIDFGEDLGMYVWYNGFEWGVITPPTGNSMLSAHLQVPGASPLGAGQGANTSQTSIILAAFGEGSPANGIGTLRLADTGDPIEGGILEVARADSLPARPTPTIGAGGTVAVASGLVTAPGADAVAGGSAPEVVRQASNLSNLAGAANAPLAMSGRAATQPAMSTERASQAPNLPALVVKPAAEPPQTVTEKQQKAGAIAAEFKTPAAPPPKRTAPAKPARPTAAATASASLKTNQKAHDIVLQAGSLKRPAPDVVWLQIVEPFNGRKRSGQSANAWSAIDQVLAALGR
jgi:hypothetical protein